MVAGENERDHIRTALEEEATMDAGPAVKDILSESTNVYPSVEMRAAESFCRHPH